jgi:hypothetical protein
MKKARTSKGEAIAILHASSLSFTNILVNPRMPGECGRYR